MKLRSLLLATYTLLLISCSEGLHQYGDGITADVMTITTQNVELSEHYSASIRGAQDIRIIPRVDGYLTNIAVKEGEKVKKGQVLFIVDQVPFLADLRAAKANTGVCKANVENAQLTFNSKKALFEKEIVSEFDYNSALIALNMAKAQLEQAKAQELAAENNLSYSEIKSPSDGVVGKINFREGDYVSSALQEGLTIVSNNTEMFVYFSMSESDVMRLIDQHGDPENVIQEMEQVKLLLSNRKIYSINGRVESISGIVDPNTGSVSIRAVFPNPKGHLLSGGAGSVIIPYIDNQAILIPQEATFEIQDKVYVYKIIEGKTESAMISVHKINNGKDFIVLEGLKQGDVIIAKGAGLVQEGVSVQSQK